MSQNFQTNYQPLEGYENDPERGSVEDVDLDREREDDMSPDTHSSMVFHVVPKSSKSHWNHIEDLDTFFKRVYLYHQNSGLLCMMLQHVLELVQFMFVVVFSSFLITCVDYDILFRNKNPVNFNATFTEKITIWDVLRSHDDCIARFTSMLIFVIVVAAIVWLVRLGYVTFIFFQFREIRMFFNKALAIPDKELGNITWEEVQQRLMEVQVEQRMCIHKEVLTELDVYHRILRFTNYFIAMVNKNIIPLKYEMPFVGEVVVLTKGLHLNIDMLLFWGPLSPFKNNWHLNDEYKRPENRLKLAEDLSKRILIIGICNLVLSPLIFLFQVLYTFFYYAETIKREPGSLGSRRWSNYGAVYLRHFNELDHELSARLCRGHKAAGQYMNIFSSPALAIISRHLSFILGAVVAVIAGFTLYDEDVFLVEHIFTIATVCGIGVAACSVFIPDENLVFCPEMLLRRVLGEVHYLPDHWREKAHTSKVRQEFSQLFQYKILYVIEELMSPIITPLVLIFRLRFKSLEIVDFFRNFTVEVVGVGDVCSFAQMDVRQHGSPTWQPDILLEETELHEYNDKSEMKTDGGKTELSLLHFTMTNPKWRPPKESSAFISALKTQAQRDMNALTTLQEENALFTSINTISGVGGLGAANTSIFHPWMMGLGGQTSMQIQQSYWSPKGLRGSLSHVEGSRHGPSGGILSSIQQHQMGQSSIECPIGTSAVTSGPVVDPVLAPSTVSPSSVWGGNMAPTMPQDLTAVDMSLSTMYLHEIHHRHRHRTIYTDTPIHHASVRPSALPAGGGTFQNVSFRGQPSVPPASGSNTPTVTFQHAQEKTPLLPDP
ncbi:Autophagy-related protein 9A [Halocaridina rubra]|uniref:Autophagy-related protein 9 n=1 Tax=Halocaridina rubra TaxID=373956 RepID=A0AAN8XEI8_HALRR